MFACVCLYLWARVYLHVREYETASVCSFLKEREKEREWRITYRGLVFRQFFFFYYSFFFCQVISRSQFSLGNFAITNVQLEKRNNVLYRTERLSKSLRETLQNGHPYIALHSTATTTTFPSSYDGRSNVHWREQLRFTTPITRHNAYTYL